MKKLFQQIDDLCVGASMAGICSALNIQQGAALSLHFTIRMGNQDYIMPTDRLWRRKWRKFLTDHVDDVANNLDAVAAAAHASQPGSGA